MTVAVSAVTELLGGSRVLGTNPASLAEMRAAIRQGFPRGAVLHMARSIAVNRRDERALVHGIVPEATLKRRRERLSAAESERTERLARVAALAFEIWGEEDGRRFLGTPHSMLGGETPIQAAVTDLGGREVESILKALEHGLPV